MTEKQKRIARAFRDGASRAECAKQFDVSLQAVDDAVREALRQSWTPAAYLFADPD